MSNSITGPDVGLRTAGAWAVAPVDVFESDSEFLLVTDLPGFTASAVDVTWEGNAIRISASRSGEDWADVAGGTTKWHRSVRMRCAIDADSATADLKCGVLQVHVPKAKNAMRREIPVVAAPDGGQRRVSSAP